ncbi:Hydroxyindole-O-methyltransferase [Handroanthus impetiginosus]|uniref:Hydroxyindole-O-methyltransferase n=1 Tax=Handroanthus impetiginosus TaxID=429701 RepID=A0A2G9G8D8_9LAMI|nr:Hydroxyindole-O-methyltransferase [Handroanthus impetiginosus]
MELPNGKESTQELLDAQTHIWNHIFKFINTMSLQCAIQLDISNIIHKHGKPMTLIELTNALPISKANSQYISRLMHLLVHLDFFIKVNISDDDPKEGYWLTPASHLLLKDKPLSILPFVQVIVDPILIEPWHYLSKWLASDHHQTPFEMAHGQTFWEQAERVPRLNDLFNEAMASDAGLVNLVLLRNSKQLFGGFESLMDVGGGTGATARAISEAFPELKCTVLDLPLVVVGLKGIKNLSFLEGDMFDAIPHADVVLLKWILHDWNDEASVRILKKCKDAISNNKDKGGKVIIIDMILNNHVGGDKVIEDQLFYDMAMMAYVDGKERTEEEWAKLFFDAGFSSYKIALELGVRSLIEVYP